MRNVLLLGHACAPVRRLRAAPRREGPTGQIEGTLASANVGQTNPEGATRNHPLMVFTGQADELQIVLVVLAPDETLLAGRL